MLEMPINVKFYCSCMSSCESSRETSKDVAMSLVDVGG